MMKKYILLFVLGLFTCGAVFSQEYIKHEMSFWGMGGLSTLKYDMKAGKRKDAFGGGAGVGYTYYLSRNVGLNTGIEFTFYNSTSTLNHLETSYMAQELNGNQFLFKSAIDDYEESLNASFANVPIQIQLQFPVGKDEVYIIGGIKFGIPINAAYKAEKGFITNSGYFEYEDIEYKDIPSLGFSTYNAKKEKEDYDPKLAYILSLEGGMKWELPHSLYLYTGLYLDYGLNDIGKGTRNKNFIEYNTEKPSKQINNGMLASEYGSPERKESFTDKIHPVAFGVKFRLGFNLTN